MRKTLSAFIILCLSNVSTYAQVKFKLSRMLDRQTYIVSMISDKTYEGSQNITGTAQVTLKVDGKSDFLIREISSLQPETNWVNNATISKHALAPDYVYVSFGMQTMAHSQFNYIKGNEIPLFSFKNVGDIKANISLLNNDLDVMAQSTQKTKYNIKNYISILGHGPGNAYLNNVEPVAMSPDDAMKTYVLIQNLYPNPASVSDKVMIDWENQLEDAEAIETMDLVIFDIAGFEKMRQPISKNYGKNSQQISIQSFTAGSYFLKLQRDGKFSTQTHKFIIIK